MKYDKSFFTDHKFFILQAMVRDIQFNWGVRLRSLLYKPFFKHFGNNIRIKDGVTFKYPSEIEIGNNCTIGENCYFVGRKGLKIGDDALIGSGSKIITSTHIFDRRDITIREQGLRFDKVELGCDIWLGFNVTILSGSTIADGCIVGSNSLVNSKFMQPCMIIAGTPAKVLKDRPLSILN